eukprot:366387-Chlamydomonas_euryale.AAC.32
MWCADTQCVDARRVDTRHVDARCVDVRCGHVVCGRAACGCAVCGHAVCGCAVCGPRAIAADAVRMALLSLEWIRGQGDHAGYVLGTRSPHPIFALGGGNGEAHPGEGRSSLGSWGVTCWGGEEDVLLHTDHASNFHTRKTEERGEAHPAACTMQYAPNHAPCSMHSAACTMHPTMHRAPKLCVPPPHRLLPLCCMQDDGMFGGSTNQLVQLGGDTALLLLDTRMQRTLNQVWTCACSARSAGFGNMHAAHAEPGVDVRMQRTLSRVWTCACGARRAGCGHVHASRAEPFVDARMQRAVSRVCVDRHACNMERGCCPLAHSTQSAMCMAIHTRLEVWAPRNGGCASAG